MSCLLSPEKKIILLLSRANPSASAMKNAEDLLEDRRPVDYAAMAALASMNGVSPLLYHNLKAFDRVAEKAPRNVIDQLRTAFLLTVKDNAAKIGEIVRVIDFLRAKGIESIPLKGPFASDVILGSPGLYPSSDIDILVRPSDLDGTVRALMDMGYVKSGGVDERDMLRGTYHLTFHSDRYVIEVHWTLTFRYFDIPPEFWWEETEAAEYEGTEIHMLSPERYILHTIFRLYNKAFRPLKFFVLPAEIINRHKERIDWYKLLSFAGRYRMERLVLFTLRLLNDLLGASIPDRIADARIYGYDFLKRVVISGLFQEDSRTHARMLLFTILQDTPFDTLKVLLGRAFPDESEIRLRYGLSHGSRKVYFYYFLNPLLLLFGKRR